MSGIVSDSEVKSYAEEESIESIKWEMLDDLEKRSWVILSLEHVSDSVLKTVDVRGNMPIHEVVFDAEEIGLDTEELGFNFKQEGFDLIPYVSENATDETVNWLFSQESGASVIGIRLKFEESDSVQLWFECEYETLSLPF